MGYGSTMLVSSVIQSGTNALYVCYAEDPVREHNVCYVCDACYFCYAGDHPLHAHVCALPARTCTPLNLVSPRTLPVCKLSLRPILQPSTSLSTLSSSLGLICRPRALRSWDHRIS